MSRTRSDRGREQQMSTWPSDGASSGSGEYETAPDSRGVTHVWHTPLRQLHRLGTSQASARSRRLPQLAAKGGGNPAAGEGHQRPGAGRSGRRVRRRGGGADHARVGGGQGGEQFRVNTGGLDAGRAEGVAHVGHVRRRPAHVRLRAGRQAERGQRVLGDVPGHGMRPVQLGRRGLAVEQVLAGVRQRPEQGAGLGGEWMFPRAARAVDPPDLAFTAGLGQLVQHGQDRGYADAGGDQQHRS